MTKIIWDREQRANADSKGLALFAYGADDGKRKVTIDGPAEAAKVWELLRFVCFFTDPDIKTLEQALAAVRKQDREIAAKEKRKAQSEHKEKALQTKARRRRDVARMRGG